MPHRRLARLVSPVLTFVEWLFSPCAPGLDLFLSLLGGGWLVLMLTRPEIFDRGNFVGMQWLPDTGWIAFVATVTSLHVVGFARLHFHRLRVAACLLSAWYWLLIDFSLTRVSLSTGTLTYALIGSAALVAAIYLSGPRSRQSH